MGNRIPEQFRDYVVTSEQFRDYVVTSLPRLVVVPGHREPAPFWIAPDMFPGVGLRVAGLDASTRVGKSHAEPHVHDAPNYVFGILLPDWKPPGDAETSTSASGS